MTWHIDPGLLTAYIDDELDYARNASVEAHLTGCGTCQSDLRLAVSEVPALADRHADSWERLTDQVDQPRLAWLERALVRCGVSEATARVIAASELTARAWVAGFAVLVVAILFSMIASEAIGVATFLLLVPVLPVPAVALAYGARGEPAYELAVVAPYSSSRRLLLRTLTALAVSLPVAAVLSLAVPEVQPVLWLLPAVALTLLTLAAITFVRPLYAAAGVAAAWLLVNLAALPGARGSIDRLLDLLPQARGGGQVLLVALCAVAAALTVARRARFERITPA